MRTRIRVDVMAALLVAVLGATLIAAEIRVAALVKDGMVEVSFRLEDGFTREMSEAIRSGLPTTITYEVELRRHVFAWFDRTIDSATVTASVQFDNLTRQHQLTRKVDGRGEPPQLTEEESAVREWLTSCKPLPLFATERLEPNVEYYVRVRARTHPRVSWAFWPWDRGGVSGSATFTLIR
jgi:hypothetical protein